SAHGQPDPHELGQLRGLPHRGLEGGIDHGQMKVAVAAEPAQRGAHVDREADERRHGIAGEAEEQPAAAGPERQRLARLLRHLPEASLHAEGVERLLDEVELAPRAAPRRAEGARGAGGAGGARPRMSSRRWRRGGRPAGPPPASATAAARTYALLLTTCPGPGVSSTSTSSAPVERIATRGRRCT